MDNFSIWTLAWRFLAQLGHKAIASPSARGSEAPQSTPESRSRRVIWLRPCAWSRVVLISSLPLRDDQCDVIKGSSVADKMVNGFFNGLDHTFGAHLAVF